MTKTSDMEAKLAVLEAQGKVPACYPSCKGMRQEIATALATNKALKAELRRVYALAKKINDTMKGDEDVCWRFAQEILNGQDKS